LRHRFFSFNPSSDPAIHPALDLARRHVTPIRLLVFGIGLAAFVVRAWSIDSGVPHAVDPIEARIVQRVLRILQAGEWNPQAFETPTLLLYLQAAVTLIRFMAGASAAEWGSVAAFDVAASYDAGRTVVAAIGAATVLVTYRLGREVASERVGLLAAAQLALLPAHVGESHLITPDVLLTALTTLAVYVAIRSEHLRGAWAWAGVMAGLAAATRYSGALALAPVFVAALMRRDALSVRLRSCGIALGAAALAFVAATPYAVLDLPAFLNSFAARAAAFADGRHETDGIWAAYAAYLLDAARLWLPLMAAGLLMIGHVFLRRAGRVRWMPILTFVTLFGWMLVTHGPASDRLALPLTPMLCLIAGLGLDGLCRLILSVPSLRVPAIRHTVPVALVLVLLVPFAQGVLTWTRQFARRDTRQVAADWLKGSLPRGTRIAVEEGGPTHLQQAGFDERDVDRLIDYPFEWYEQQRIEYVVVSSESAWSRGYADVGVKVIDIPSLPQRPGPGIRVIRLARKAPTQ
jgi:4-amino-4-deoxy-L-arabinose transferase-like glycosyltransferase